jgi:YggT family protein
MTVVFGALVTLAAGLRSVLLVGGVVLAAIAAADWAVRTRRLNPFGGVARFLRSSVDPRLAGIERQVTRAGGHPSSTPLWALVAYVIAAALLIAAVDMVIGLLGQAVAATSMGAVGIVMLLIHWVFTFLRLALLVRVISSWFPRAAYSPWVRWSFPATEWMLGPLRRVIPSLGVIDITPIVAYFGLQLVEGLILPALLPGF